MQRIAPWASNLFLVIGVVGAALVVVASLTGQAAHAQTDNPNVVVIMVDNHGWG